jgi:hypothetical protein
VSGGCSGELKGGYKLVNGKKYEGESAQRRDESDGERREVLRAFRACLPIHTIYCPQPYTYTAR